MWRKEFGVFTLVGGPTRKVNREKLEREVGGREKERERERERGYKSRIFNAPLSSKITSLQRRKTDIQADRDSRINDRSLLHQPPLEFFLAHHDCGHGAEIGGHRDEDAAIMTT